MKASTKQELLEKWLEEERTAHIKGWDFSHIHNRYKEEDELPWDFKTVIKKYLTEDMTLLDMETGGGEFLLSLNHPYALTSATEGYPPNVDYCREKLLPLGIDFKEADGFEALPFGEDYFDLITNRHGDYEISELQRTLKKGGLFITQQVGAENDIELVELLLGKAERPYPKQYLEIKRQELIEAGFDILESGEAYRPIRFYDVGALVWFAKIIEWEFPGFAVKTHLPQLYRAQEILDDTGVIEGSVHRFYLVARLHKN